MDTSDFFHSDVSLPQQYWERFAKGRDLDPEKRLLAAVLEDAVESYRAYVLAGGRMFLEAEAWIFSDDNKQTFSFRNICETLGLSPSRIRRSLRSIPLTAGARKSEKPARPARRAAHARGRKAPAAREAPRRRPAGFTLAP
jgi:hypothetical protein